MISTQKALRVPVLLILTGLLIIPLTQAATLSLESFAQFQGPSYDASVGTDIATGDLNGDGYDESILAAPSKNTIYIARGKAGRYRGDTILSGSSIAVWTGDTSLRSSGYLGGALAVGDLNADGFEDVVVADQGDDDAGGNAGAIYIIYGHAGRTGSLDFLDGTLPKFTGEGASDAAGSAVSVGDTDGDGYDDIVVSAKGYGYSDVDNYDGKIYLIKGQDSELTSMSLLDASTATWVGENPFDHAGSSIAIGDINGDGLEDILTSASGNDDGGDAAGAVYLIYGSSDLSGENFLSDASMVQLTGEAMGDCLCEQLKVGDINRDGFGEILIPSYNDDAGVDAGAVYLIYGSSTTLSSMVLSDTSVVKFTGEDMGDYAGKTIAVADQDGDGWSEIIIGAVGQDEAANDAGAVYIVRGQEERFSSFRLSSPSAIKLLGEAENDYAANQVATGDLNGDGLADILVGASGNNSTSVDAGAVYVIYGR
jgi:hypothetical protein